MENQSIIYKQRKSKSLCVFSDGSSLYFGRGKFDNWCVFFSPAKIHIDRIPLDREYFSDIKQLGEKYGNERVYKDFVSLYDKTNYFIEQSVLNSISEIAGRYDKEDLLRVEKLFSILYLTMIAEENKEHAPLGKRIKRLGVYRVLMENCDADKAADEDKKRYWLDIASDCDRKGF